MWLYVPTPEQSISSPSAPVAEGSISASSWHWKALEASVWWRGKPSPSRTWFQRCNRVSYIRLLCGAMPEPSTADAGVAAWTASLAASRASRTALPDASRGGSTSATCGPTRGASSSSRDAGSCSSKTSPACSRRGLTKSLEPKGFGETYASWVSRLRQDCSRRRNAARRTSASASSSSAWPTASADFLTGDTKESYEARAARLKAKHKGRTGNGAGMTLSTAAQIWPTPTANDFKGSGPTLQRSDGKMRGDRLDYAAEQLWSTPRSADGEKGSPNQKFGAGGTPLPAQASQWSTPSIADVAGGRASRSGERSGELLMNGQAKSLSSRLDPAISKDGAPSSNGRRSLNPLFVGWLMGWPPIASTGFGFSATGWCPWKARMRSALSQLASPTAAPPVQTSLFG